MLSGRLYDRYADPITHACVGRHCYRTYFMIASLALVGTCAVAAGLTVRQYQGDKRRGALGDVNQTYRSIS